jgi:hypothetical protein
VLEQIFDRRDVLRWSAGVSAGLFGAGTAQAEGDGIGDFLGKLLGLVPPSKPVNLVRTIAAIVELERAADSRGIPPSRLSLIGGNSVALPNNETSLYQSALPRLVTLIDRCEVDDPALSEQAGAVLADINAAEHVVPDATPGSAGATTLPA